MTSIWGLVLNLVFQGYHVCALPFWYVYVLPCHLSTERCRSRSVWWSRPPCVAARCRPTPRCPASWRPSPTARSRTWCASCRRCRATPRTCSEICSARPSGWRTAPTGCSCGSTAWPTGSPGWTAPWRRVSRDRVTRLDSTVEEGESGPGHPAGQHRGGGWVMTGSPGWTAPWRRVSHDRVTRLDSTVEEGESGPGHPAGQHRGGGWVGTGLPGWTAPWRRVSRDRVTRLDSAVEEGESGPGHPAGQHRGGGWVGTGSPGWTAPWRRVSRDRAAATGPTEWVAGGTGLEGRRDGDKALVNWDEVSIHN